MGKSGIPDRWLPYSPMGSIVPGTRFIACKVPLKDGLLRSLPEKQRFGPKDLLKALPKIGLLIDLTNTMRYYFKEDFTDKGVRYEKIFCPGQVVPPNSIVKQFFQVVDGYLASETDPDTLIVVHCTHGVNRTGYFICRYMIEILNMSPEEALKNFQKARGHAIEREIYVSDLKNGCKGGDESDMCFVSNPGFREGGKRSARRHMANSRGGYRFAPDRRNDFEEKRQQNSYYQNSSDYHSNGKWRNSNQKYKFSKFDREPKPEEDSNNWRDHNRNPNGTNPSTTPLPLFTPTPPQDSLRPPYPVKTSRHEQPPTTRHSNRDPPHRRTLLQTPTFCHTDTSAGSGPSSSRLVGDRPSMFNPDNSYYSSGRKMGDSAIGASYHGSIPGRGGIRGRGGNWGGSSRWSDGGNNYSR